MYNTRQQPRKEVTDRIDITEYVRTFLQDLSQIEGRRVKVNTYADAYRVRMLLQDPKYTSYKSFSDLQTGIPYWNEQGVVFFPSNLGVNKGYLFFFLCNGCDRRTKYLFRYSEMSSPLCRQCCRFPYKQASYKMRKISRLERERLEKVDLHRAPMALPDFDEVMK